MPNYRGQPRLWASRLQYPRQAFLKTVTGRGGEAAAQSVQVWYGGSPTNDFATYCCELLSGVGPCTARRMFGGFGISTSGLTFALVADLGGGEKLWLKADTDSEARFEQEGCERFTYEMTRNGVRKAHSLNYYSAPEEAMESPQLMLHWARISLDCALKARAGKPKKKRPAPGAATRSRASRS